jgi:hypothetical protein
MPARCHLRLNVAARTVTGSFTAKRRADTAASATVGALPSSV